MVVADVAGRNDTIMLTSHKMHRHIPAAEAKAVVETQLPPTIDDHCRLTDSCGTEWISFTTGPTHDSILPAMNQTQHDEHYMYTTNSTLEYYQLQAQSNHGNYPTSTTTAKPRT
jgi:hypothetical protein